MFLLASAIETRYLSERIVSVAPNCIVCNPCLVKPWQKGQKAKDRQPDSLRSVDSKSTRLVVMTRLTKDDKWITAITVSPSHALDDHIKQKDDW